MRKYEITIGKKVYDVTVNSFTNESAELEIDGHTYDLQFKGPVKTVMDGSMLPQVTTLPPPTFQPSAGPSLPAQSVASSPKAPGGAGTIMAPIPGSITAILVKVGDQVEKGQLVIKMEAMKMENEINASHAGKVTSIDINVGDAVSQGDKLITID